MRSHLCRAVLATAACALGMALAPGGAGAQPGPDGGVAADAAAPDVAPAAAPAPAPAAAAVPVTPLSPLSPPQALGRGAAGDDSPLDHPDEPGASGEPDSFDGLDLASLLDNVVVSATKSELREDEAPAITTVITRDEIRRWGYQSVAEVLTHVAGVYVIDDQILPNIGIRGVSGGLRSESGLIKVMIDGRSVAFRSTSGNWLGAELVPMTAVQQIEIIRGPASSLYGADAFLGIINIVTRRPDQLDGGEALVSGTYRPTTFGWDQDVSVGAAHGRWEFLASFRNSDQDHSGLQLPASSPEPHVPSYAPLDGRTNHLTLGSQVALGALTYHLASNATLTMTGYYSSIDRGAEFADWQQLTHNVDSSGRSAGTDISLRHGFANLGLAVQAAPKLDLRFNATAFAGGPGDRDRIEVGSDVYYIERQFGYRGFDLEGEASFRPRTSLSMLIGAGLILDSEQLPEIYRVLKEDSGNNKAGDRQLDSAAVGNVQLWNPGAHVLVLWAPLRRFSLTTGVRYDYHNVYGGKPSARVGGVVQLASNLHFKLLYGSAFKAPSPQLLYGSPITVGDISGNQQLKPSYVHTVEGQIVLRPNAYVHLTSGVAYNYVIDQAEFARVGLNQVARNVSQMQSISFESELRVDYRRKLAAYANASFNRTWRQLAEPGYVASLTSYSNPAYPAFVAHAGASAHVPRMPLSLSVEGSYVSSRASSGGNALAAGQEYFLAPYFMLGASVRTAGIELLPGRMSSFALTGRNILDRRVTDPGFAGIDYPQLGRTLMLHLLQEL